MYFLATVAGLFRYVWVLERFGSASPAVHLKGIWLAGCQNRVLKQRQSLTTPGGFNLLGAGAFSIPLVFESELEMGDSTPCCSLCTAYSSNGGLLPKSVRPAKAGMNSG